MSYGRYPYYIYSDGEEIYLDGTYVSEEIINVFLYKLFLKNRRQELKERLLEGRKSWLKIDKDDGYIKWLVEQEDELIKRLIE